MRREKPKTQPDKVEEALQSLRVLSSKGLKSVSSEFGDLKQGLTLFDSNLPPRLKSGFERNLDRMEAAEKKLSGLEVLFRENFQKVVEGHNLFKSKLEELEEANRILEILYELSRLIHLENNLNTMLDMVVDGLVDLISAERSFLLILGEEGSVKTKIGKNRDKEPLEEKSLNQSIIDAVVETGDAILVSGLLISEEEEKDEPAKMISVLCIPLRCGDQTNGVFYLDNSGMTNYFTTDDARVCFSLAEKVVFSLERNFAFGQLTGSEGKRLEELRGKFKFGEILGNSPQMAEILETVAEVADTDATVLVEGESGTGKELLARAIHSNSSRCGKPFVTINCAAIPETLLESELFGYEKGAFTGAEQRKPGKFEQCNEGTIFLDEIGDMSLLTQSKVLRILERQEFERLGGEQTIKTDVRIISATNKDLLSMVKENRFREDLYYRINVINMKLPPLRERRADIEPLALFFVSRFIKKNNKKIKGIERGGMNALCRYGFPGNVRELENIMERAVILAKADHITTEDLPRAVFGSPSYELTGKTPQNYAELKARKKKLIQETEEGFLEYILSKHKHNISQAAREAKMHRVELQRLIRKHKA